MSYFISDFNWTSGVDTFEFFTDSPGCVSGLGKGWTIPPANGSNSDGLTPRAVIPDASIVANITKVTDFKGNITIAPCEFAGRTSPSEAWKPVVGQLTVIQGQCINIFIQLYTTNCSSNKLEIESALIGDFCARSPAADVCKDHDPKVTVPPAVRASKGEDTSVFTNITTAPSNGSASVNTPSTDVKSGGPNRHSTRRVVMASLITCVAMAMALL